MIKYLLHKLGFHSWYYWTTNHNWYGAYHIYKCRYCDKSKTKKER